MKRPASLAFALAALLVLPLLAGCGDEPKPTEPGDGFTASRATQQALLEDWFAKAYSQQNAARYSEMLDADFNFEFMRADADTLQQSGVLPPGQNWWGRSSDITSTGTMFGSQNVGQIFLQIVALRDSVSTACEGCRKIEAVINLSVTTSPQSPDSLTLFVGSNQIFIVRPDPADSAQWVLFRQEDVEWPWAGSTEVEATEPVTWGTIKSLFAPPAP